MKKIAIITAMLLVVPCLAFAQPIPDTGQTKCYDDTQEITCPNPGEAFYGQDAQFVYYPQSYTKLDENGDDLPVEATSWVMVRDNVTGLIWEVKNSKDGTPDYNNPHDVENQYTWYDSNPATNGGDPGTPGDGTDTEDFIAALNSAQFGGYSDWRLPNIRELSYIVDRDNLSPPINTVYFPNIELIQYPTYWTSTTDASNSTNAWGVYFNINGTADKGGKTAPHYARAVRGVEVEPLGNFIDNEDGTITDTRTGLMWQQETISDEIPWQEKLSYCENLTLGGYDDWRLPDVNELQSLVDYSRYDPAIDPVFTMGPYYFSLYTSSTTVLSQPEYCMAVGFNDGHVQGHAKEQGYQFRAVRGPDLDSDGIPYLSDNCPKTPNGPNLGTCTSGNVGATCTSNAECDPNGFCSMNQEDMDLDGIGDACDNATMCRGLADFDQDVDAADVTVFLSHFGRSQYNNPCPIDGPSPVPRTGQTTSYATGDDGDLQRGVALVTPRFTDNGDGTVTDNQTGLIWLKNANCFGMRTWNNALSDCNGLASGSCGLTDGSNAGDWRLPHYKELFSLVDAGNYNPALPSAHPFDNAQPNNYWSSTTLYGVTDAYWDVDLYWGNVYYHGWLSTYYLWCVRGGH